MPSGFAFFPWVYTDETVNLGALNLLPYRRGELPGNLTHITQGDMDEVVGAYANRPGHQIKRAMILELSEWSPGTDVTPEIVSAMFRAKNMIAASALSQRSFFRQHFDYCNYDTYTLVVQRFQPGKAGVFAFDSRRRDGSATQMWSSDKFAFHRPHHVDGNAKVHLDGALLSALLGLSKTHEAIYESLIEFNSANSDSQDVPEHVEVVMLKSAFEWLLGIDQNVDRFVIALANTLSGVQAELCEGPLRTKWNERWSKATRPLDAWARDFCAVRGISAHGKSRSTEHFVWPKHTHLLFASLFYPLALKKRLSDEGLMMLDDYDLERLRRIDQYLLHDPFDFDWDMEDTNHPWSEIDQEAFIHARAKLVFPHMG